MTLTVSQNTVNIDDHVYLGIPRSISPVKIPESTGEKVIDIAKMSVEARKVENFMAELHPTEIVSKTGMILKSGLQGAMIGASVGFVVGATTTLVVSAPTGELIAPIVGLGLVPGCVVVGSIVGGTIGVGYGIYKVHRLGKEFQTWKASQTEEVMRRFNAYFVNEETLAVCRFLEPCFDQVISFGIYQFPVFDECRVPHTFEYADITEHLSRDPRCPLSRQPMEQRNLHADYTRIGKIYAAYRTTLQSLSSNVEMNRELSGGIKSLLDDMNEKSNLILRKEEENLKKLQIKGEISKSAYGRRISEIADLLDPEIPSSSSLSRSLATTPTVSIVSTPISTPELFPTSLSSTPKPMMDVSKKA